MNRLERAVRLGSHATGNPKALVLLHGLGSNEQDLMSLAPQLDPRLHVVSYRAPISWNGGFAWFEIGFDSNGLRVNQDQAVEAAHMLSKELESLPDELEISQGDIILGGFSQGGMMTLGVSLNRPELLSGAIVLSGAVVPRMTESPDARASSVPHYVQHGTADPVVPVSSGREVRDLLTQLNVPLEYHEYPMGHEVSFQSLLNITGWLARVASI